MFICGKCRTQQDTYQHPHRVVVETRKKEYRANANISTGWEVVREIEMCGSCAALAGPPNVVEHRKLEAGLAGELTEGFRAAQDGA